MSAHSFPGTVSPLYGVIILVWWPHHPIICPLIRFLLDQTSRVSAAQQLPGGSDYAARVVFYREFFTSLGSCIQSATLKTLSCSHWAVPEPWRFCVPDASPCHSSSSHAWSIFTWTPCLSFLNFDRYKMFQNKNFFSLWRVCNLLCFRFFHQMFLIFSFTFNLSIRNF